VQKAGRLPFGYPTGLLAQYVQKAGRLPFGYPTGLLAEIAHSFLSVAILSFKTQYQTKE